LKTKQGNSDNTVKTLLKRLSINSTKHIKFI